VAVPSIYFGLYQSIGNSEKGFSGGVEIELLNNGRGEDNNGIVDTNVFVIRYQIQGDIPRSLSMTFSTRYKINQNQVTIKPWKGSQSNKYLCCENAQVGMTVLEMNNNLNRAIWNVSTDGGYFHYFEQNGFYVGIPNDLGNWWGFQTTKGDDSKFLIRSVGDYRDWLWVLYDRTETPLTITSDLKLERNRSDIGDWEIFVIQPI
jgi:hypothetical protein